MIRISFILPCYTVEKYIHICLDSIYNTALSIGEFEVLCFDDHSADNTPKILDEYSSRYPNIHVIHSNINIGPGGGRNRLLNVARGGYVWFVDSDDKIISEEVIDMLQMAEDNRLDVLLFDYKEWSADGLDITKSHLMIDSSIQKGMCLSDKAFVGGIVNHMGYPVRFLLRREYLLQNNIFFPENMMYGEDTAWMLRVVLLSERMQSTSKSAYIYWHHEDSTCGTMDRIYPGRTIYERTMLTSLQLLDFVNELKEKYSETDDQIWLQHAKAIESYTKSRYINGLPIMLFRSSKSERAVFYKFLTVFENKKWIKSQAGPLTRLLMNPIIGPFVSNIMSMIYKMSH